MAAEIVVFCPGAVQSVVRELVKSYEQKSGNTVKFEFGTAGAVAKRVAEGEQGDVVIATNGRSRQARHAGQGRRRKHSRSRQHGRRRRGQGRQRRSPTSTMSTSFKKSMLAAKSIMYANPAKGGQSGIHIAKVFAEIGLDKQIASKVQLRDRGPDGLKEVAKGDIEIGLGQISEILANKDVVLVGPFPAAIQGAVTFSAAVHAGARTRRRPKN